MFPRLSKAIHSLHLFSGEDYHIIQKLNDRKINRNFNFIGFCVIVICMICLFSAGIFMYNILEGTGKLMSIPIGLFWGFTVTTIYVLLLYTITPPLLIDRSMVSRKKKKYSAKSIEFQNVKNIGKWLSYSMVLRLIFIVVFALIIAQPINVLLFGKIIKPDIDGYRMYFKSEMILNSDSLKIKEEQKLHDEFYQKMSLRILSKSDDLELRENLLQMNDKESKDIYFLQQAIFYKNALAKIEKKFDKKSEDLKKDYVEKFHQLSLEEIESDRNFLEELKQVYFENPEIQKEYDDFKKNFVKIIEEKNTFNEKTVHLIDNNNFYIRQIIMLNSKTIIARLMNLFFISLFVYPIYLKFNVRKIRRDEKENFYRFKEREERDFVIKNYQQFKINFEKILSEKNTIAYQNTLRNLNLTLNKLEKIKSEKAKEIQDDIHKRYQRNFSFYEKYLDPPFNLKDREENIYEHSEASFIDEVWKDDE